MRDWVRTTPTSRYFSYLLVVNEDSGLELLGYPLEQIATVLRLDIDEHALGEEDGGQGEVHFGLLQLIVHLVEVAQIHAHQVIARPVQIRGTQAHLAVLVVDLGQQGFVAFDCVAFAGSDRGEVQLDEVLHLVGGVP